LFNVVTNEYNRTFWDCIQAVLKLRLVLHDAFLGELPRLNATAGPFGGPFGGTSGIAG